MLFLYMFFFFALFFLLKKALKTTSIKFAILFFVLNANLHLKHNELSRSSAKCSFSAALSCFAHTGNKASKQHTLKNIL